MVCKTRVFLSSLAAGVLAIASSPTAAATELTLNVVQYPDKRGVEVPFTATSRAPVGASLEADVNHKEGQARIDVSYQKMQPAVLFGGNVTAYVLWAVSGAGIVENLGELWVSGENGSGRFQTGMKEFALFVSAEPVAGIWRPSDMVVFWSGPTQSRYAKNSTLAFSAFGPALKHDRESIGALRWQGQEPIELYQARKAVEMALDMGLDKYDAKSMGEAQTTLAQATNSQGSGGSSKAVTDYSRRTVALVTTAGRAMYKAQQEKAEAEAAAKRKAEVDALSQKATAAQESAAAAEAARQQAEEAGRHAEELRSQAEIQKDEAERAKAEMAATAAALDVQKRELETQMTALAAENERTRAERDALAQRLVGALAGVAETQNTARGVVVSLSDILFDTNKATLKPEAQVALAKLCGVLSVFPDLNLRVEGYTDSTGTDEINNRLSKERATSVVAFLSKEGIAGTRITSEGYGPRYPAASNDTKEGRSKNRRVEIVLAEGVVAAPTP
ncbi:MAG: OmpA family protein [Thermoanaerobaculia bacterium]